MIKKTAVPGGRKGDCSLNVLAGDEREAGAEGVNGSPTEEEKEAAASTPILYALAQTAAMGRASSPAHRCGITGAARRTAQVIADGIINLSAEPTERNKARLVDELAKALHLASAAAVDGIAIPAVRRYHADINANHFTALFASAARAILTAHDDGRREDEAYLAALYDDATSAIRRAAAHTPIRHADAAAIMAAVDELNEAVANI